MRRLLPCLCLLLCVGSMAQAQSMSAKYREDQWCPNIINPTTSTKLWHRWNQKVVVTAVDCIADPRVLGEEATVNVYKCDSAGINCAQVLEAVACANQTVNSFSADQEVAVGEWLRLSFSNITGTIDPMSACVHWRVQ